MTFRSAERLRGYTARSALVRGERPRAGPSFHGWATPLCKTGVAAGHTKPIRAGRAGWRIPREIKGNGGSESAYPLRELSSQRGEATCGSVVGSERRVLIAPPARDRQKLLRPLPLCFPTTTCSREKFTLFATPCKHGYDARKPFARKGFMTFQRGCIDPFSELQVAGLNPAGRFQAAGLGE
jgi:hypothetical protein